MVECRMKDKAPNMDSTLVLGKKDARNCGQGPAKQTNEWLLGDAAKYAKKCMLSSVKQHTGINKQTNEWLLADAAKECISCEKQITHECLEYLREVGPDNPFKVGDDCTQQFLEFMKALEDLNPGPIGDQKIWGLAK